MPTRRRFYEMRENEENGKVATQNCLIAILAFGTSLKKSEEGAILTIQ
jgi:hypothetical protein